MGDEAKITDTDAKPEPTAVTNFADALKARLVEQASEDKVAGVDDAKQPVGSEAQEVPSGEADAEEAEAEAEAEKRVKTGTDAPSEMEQLASLAKKLGYVVDKDGRVDRDERVQFRAKVRRKTEWLDKQEKTLEERENAVKSREAELESKGSLLRDEHREPLELGQRIMKARKARDYDEIAKALGYKDYNEIQREAAETYSDPHYREILELRREAEAEKKQRQQEREEQERAKAEAKKREEAEAAIRAEQEKKALADAEQRQILEAQANHKRWLSGEMAKSEDVLVRAMAGDPAFVNAVFEQQAKHYSPKTNNTLSVEDAIDSALDQSGATLRKQLQALYEKLKPAFDGVPASSAGSPAVKAAKPAGGKTAPTPNPQSAPRKRHSEMTEAEASRYFKERLRQVK